jgi:outer membrane protein TolC
MLAEKLTQTGAINKLDLARRQVFATELEAQAAGARQAAAATQERLTRLLGLWGGSDLEGRLPNALPAMPGKAWSLAAVERAAMERRVDLAVARLEIETLARSYGLTRATRFVNVLDLGGISKTQKDKGEPKADGGGFTIAFEVPLYDFGRARVREAEQRYREAVNSLGVLAVDARSQAREAYGAYSSARAIVAKYEGEVLPLRQTISAEVELQYNANQVDAFALLEAARAKATAQVASIEAKRNFWIAAADLSAAVLGGGGLSQESATFAAADASASAGH